MLCVRCSHASKFETVGCSLVTVSSHFGLSAGGVMSGTAAQAERASPWVRRRSSFFISYNLLDGDGDGEGDGDEMMMVIHHHCCHPS